MRILFLILMMLGFVGFVAWPKRPITVESQVGQAPVAYTILGLDDLVRKLNSEAEKRKIYWHIWCTANYEGDKEKYLAIATYGSQLNLFVEDGAADYWAITDYAKSREEAAAKLLKLLQGPPNRPPQSRVDRKPAVCYHPLEGGPN